MKRTHLQSCESPWPDLDYQSWSDTLKTIHMWSQIVGKIRMVNMPWQNHSWHSTLYITPRGITTGSIPYKNGIYAIEFDFKNHQLMISSSFEKTLYIDLYPRSVADFYKELLKQLNSIGIEVDIYAAPNEVEVSIPFEKNEQDHSYDKQKIADFWQIAINTNNIFNQFRSRFIGKCSPVHLFWGAFDIAVTRFSGRKAPLHQGEMPNMPKEVMQEAYSQEVSSCGFWPGSDQAPQPVYYSYCYPTPENFGKQQVSPEEAFYSDEMQEFFLPYEAVKTAENPEVKLLSFLQSTYEAAANTGNWDRESLER